MSLVNLLPEDYVARRAQKRANRLCALLFGVVMTGVVAAAVVSEQGHRRTRQVCDRVNLSYADAAKLIRQMQELEATKQEMLKKAKLTAGLLERVPRSYILATITNALPDGGSLTQFELTTKRRRAPDASGKKKPKSRYDVAAAKHKATPTKLTKVETTIIITGLAGTDVEVGQFIATMDRCPLIEDVVLVYTEEKKVKDTLARKFQVILYLKDDADVRRIPAVAGAPAGRDSARKM